MKTVVLGGGIIGVTTAYFLAKAGHDVTVIERQPDVGLETSFANGGLVTPSMSEPWAGPGVPLKALKWLGKADAPLLFRLRSDPAMWRWALRFLRNCTAARARVNTLRSLRIAAYSLEVLRALRAETGLTYDEQGLGVLYLFRDRKAIDGFADHIALVRENGIQVNPLDPKGVAALEPALAEIVGDLAGGMHLPGDESGDAFKFTNALKHEAEKAGVTFRFGIEIRGLQVNGDRVEATLTQNGAIMADNFVLALGSYTPLLAKTVGLGIPVYPVKGYSVTLPMHGWNQRPRIPVLDDHLKVAVTPLGDRLRGAGTAEVTGYDTADFPARSANIVRAMRAVYPGCADAGGDRHWCGLRPMTPDGPPILGATRLRNLFLNTGHGSLGWTMACGSGRVVADLVAGRKPDIDLEGLTLERYE
ncbi:MAG: D-amino acid dehydrogenase [Proteobacteria bacterium]|nr:D-amino acid dehydrogenase [Pseudomonadota bacterium]